MSQLSPLKLLPRPLFTQPSTTPLSSSTTSRSVKPAFSPKFPYLAGNNDFEAGTYRISAFNANITLSPAQWDLFNEGALTCPSKYANDFRAAHSVSTWRYRYMGDCDNLRLYNSWGEYPSSGAYHGSEPSALFGTAENVSGETSSAEQERFSRYM